MDNRNQVTQTASKTVVKDNKVAMATSESSKDSRQWWW